MEKTYAAGGVSSGGAEGYMPQVISLKVTLGDIYYKTYTEEKDTFLEFSACRDWFLNSFPPGEVNRQRARSHDGLYQAYVVGEANTRAANHQIVREWRTMVRERANWEKYRERLVREAKEFEKANAAFAEEKGKLRTAEELLSKEHAEFTKICEKDNQRVYVARNKITELEGKVTELTGKVEDAQATKEHDEVELAELKTQLSSKDKDLTAKYVEIAELKCRLREQVDKTESLEINLEAEKGKAASIEEARQKAEEARTIS
ncbi:hypothetical protein Hanom_Chr11g00993571 [Helianthus anomalus]